MKKLAEHTIRELDKMAADNLKTSARKRVYKSLKLKKDKIKYLIKYASLKTEVKPLSKKITKNLSKIPKKKLSRFVDEEKERFERVKAAKKKKSQH